VRGIRRLQLRIQGKLEVVVANPAGIEGRFDAVC
jgi:hypothetical protein